MFDQLGRTWFFARGLIVEGGSFVGFEELTTGESILIFEDARGSRLDSAVGA